MEKKMTEQGLIAQQEEIDEIIRAAREAATLHGKEWILRQLRGEPLEQTYPEQPSGGGESEKQDDDCDGKEEPEPKKQQCSASRGKKAAGKKVGKDPGLEPRPPALPASKRGKA